jgi:hypothetical protein
MIRMSFRPKFLPQMNMPIHEALSCLDKEGIEYESLEVDPTELKPSHGITFSNEIHEPNEDKFTWIDNENNIIDGHHNAIFHEINSKPVKCIKLLTDSKNAARILNKIQDIYEYEVQRKMEEDVGNDYINDQNSVDSDDNRGEFLNLLEKDSAEIENNSEGDSNNPKVIIGYRKEPINEKSIVGNFFTLTPVDGYSKYQIEFENLLDTNDLGINYKSNQVPVDVLAKNWFPNINFEKLSKEYDIPVTNLKNKAIVHKASNMGFDGIKYGDTLIQGLN